MSALANPQGGEVMAGSATITQNGNTLDIHQTSGKAVIDWRSFDIGSSETTNFYQPDKSSIALNRIRDTKPSEIFGKLNANGKVILVNQNGVFFAPGSRVDVSGIVASTADIATEKFMAGGKWHFDIAGAPDAKIIAAGTITARNAGLVGLVAPQVENSGVIEARLGKVHMASGNKFTLDFAGDGLIEVAVDGNLSKQSVINKGRINADGGSIYMTAAAARDHVDNIVANKGTLEARRISQKGGKIVLYAEGSNAVKGNKAADKGKKTGKSTVLNEGVIDVSSATPGISGGSVELLGDQVGLMAGSVINASGMNAAGGDVKIGGDYQGGGDTAAAYATYIDSGASIDASAQGAGNGGRVIVWADDTTRFFGLINAGAGADGGNGGFVEVSGHGYLDFKGDVDVTAPKGKIGELLLDPGDIVICQFGASADAACNGTPTPVLTAVANIFDSGADATSYINIGAVGTAGSLVNQLNSANVIIRTNAGGAGLGDITLADALTWTTARTLTLQAHHDININAAISAANALTLQADNTVNITAGIGASVASMALTIMSLDPASSASMGIAGGAGTLNIDAAELALMTGWGRIDFGNASLTADNDITVNAYAWSSPVRFLTGYGNVTIAGTQTLGNRSLGIYANTIDILAALSGSGNSSNLTLAQGLSTPTMGIGAVTCGGTCEWLMDATELTRIGGSWNTVTFGRGVPVAMDIGASAWANETRFNANTGSITVSGAVNTGAQLTTWTSNTINVNAAIIGSGGTSNNPVFAPATNVTMGFGTGATCGGTCTWMLDTTELGFISGGFTSVTFGLAANGSAVDMRAATINPTTVFLGAGAFTLNGAVTVGAGKNLTINSRTIALNDTLTGTGTLTLRPDTNTTVGIAGGAGAWNLDTTELGFLTPGWASLVLGLSTNTGVTTVNAWSWEDNVAFQGGNGANKMVINGNQTMNGNNLQFWTSGLKLGAGVTLTGSGGSLVITPHSTASSVSLGIGTAAGGTSNISDAVVAAILDGWSVVQFGNSGHDGVITYNANKSFTDSVTLINDLNVMNINGTLDVGNNNLSIISGRTVTINGTVSGTGWINLRSLGTSNVNRTYAGTGASQFGITAASLDKISGDFSHMYLGTTSDASSTGGTTTIGAYSNWRWPVIFRSNSTDLVFTGAQDFGAENVTFETQSNVDIRADFEGTGNLNFTGFSSAHTFGIGGGAMNILGSSIPYIKGFSNVTIGRADGTGTMAFASVGNWDNSLSNITIQALSTNISISGAQNFGDNNFTLMTNGNPAISAALSGTGALTIRNQTDVGQIRLAEAVTGLALTTAELDFISDGWSGITFGHSTLTSALVIGAYSGWKDPVTFLRDGVDTTSGIYVRGLMGTTAASDGSFAFNGYTRLESNASVTTSGGNILFNSPILVSGTASTVNAGSGNVTIMEDVTSGAQAFTVAGTGILNLYGNITTTNAAINLMDTTLYDNVTLDSGSAAISLLDMALGTHTLTMAGAGGLNLGGDFTSTNTAYAFNRNISLIGNTSINTGSGAISLLNVSGPFSFAVSGAGGLNLNGAIATTDAAIDLGRNLTLTGNSTVNAGTAAISLRDVTMGAFTFGIGGTGGLNLYGHILSTNTAVDLVRAATLMGNVTISTGNAAITLRDVTAGAHTLSFIGSGGLNLDGDITTSAAALNINRTLTLTGDSTIAMTGGLLTLNDVGGAYSFALSGTGTANLYGDIVMTNKAIDIGVAATLMDAITLNAGSAAISLQDLTVGTNVLTIAGSGGLNLGGDVTSTDTALNFTRDITLTDNVTLNAGTAAISLKAMNAGAYTLAFAGTGGLNLNGDITSTNVALDFTRDITLAGNSTLNTGTAAISLKNVNAGAHTLAFAGAGGLNLNGNITSTNTAFDISRDLTLTGDATLNAGTAAIGLKGVAAGAHTLAFAGTGGLNLNGNITSTNKAINFTRDITLAGNTQINTGSAAVSLKNVTAGAHSLTFGGAGGINLDGDITSTNVALNFTRDIILTGDSALNAGTAAISLLNVTASNNLLTFGGTGGLNINGSITASNAALDFSRDITLLGNSTLNAGTAAISLKAVSAGAYTLAFAGSGGLNLNGNITSTNKAIDFNRDITLVGNSTLNTGAAAITLNAVNAGAHTLAFAGSGSLNLNGDITSTNTALDFSRDITLLGDSTLNAGSAAVSLKNAAAGTHTLAFAGSGGLNVNGAITSTNTALNFARDITLTGNSTLDAGTAAISLTGVNTGAYTLTFGGTGGLNLDGNITSTNVALNFTRDVTLTGNSTLNAGSAAINLKNVSAGTHTLAFAGSGGLNLNGNVSSTNTALNFARDITLTGNSTLNAGSAAISLKNVNAGTHTLAFAGSGGLNLNGDITSTNTALNFTRDITLNGDSTLNAGSAAISLKNVNAGTHTLAFAGGGGLTLNGNITSSNRAINFSREITVAGTTTIDTGTADTTIGSVSIGAQTLAFAGAGALRFAGGNINSSSANIDFGRNVTLVGHTGVTSATGNISFAGALNGSADLTLETTKDIAFNGAVGNVTPLSRLIISNARHVTTDSMKLSRFDQLAGTGITTFNGTGVETSGNINIKTTGIIGTLKGVSGDFDVGDDGEITATTSFATLRLTNAKKAILSAGYIGAPGPATQEMADMIEMAPVLLPGADYSFAGFQIAYVPDDSLPSTVLHATIKPKVEWFYDKEKEDEVSDIGFFMTTASGGKSIAGGNGSNTSDIPMGVPQWMESSDPYYFLITAEEPVIELYGNLADEKDRLRLGMAAPMAPYGALRGIIEHGLN